jgi:hypothetical protein
MKFALYTISTTMLLASIIRPSLAFLGPQHNHVGRTMLNASSSKLFSTTSKQKLPVVAEESVMSQKAHGTSEKPVRKICDGIAIIARPIGYVTSIGTMPNMPGIGQKLHSYKTSRRGRKNCRPNFMTPLRVPCCLPPPSDVRSTNS